MIQVVKEDQKTNDKADSFVKRNLARVKADADRFAGAFGSMQLAA